MLIDLMDIVALSITIILQSRGAGRGVSLLYSESSVVQAVETASPAVVNVSTVTVLMDALFRTMPVQGVGSGVIIDPRGYVLTNYHVVAEANQVRVSLPDGKKFDGRLIGSDPSSDLAIIKVDARELPTVKMADSDKLRVGETAIAIGNPLGLPGGPTVTVGVISSKGRSIQTEHGLMENLIQTDAAINPGNSGGPLLNLQGEVIGITTAVVPYAQGIGFAIPINTAKMAIEDLIVHGEVRRPWLGITGIDLTPVIASHFNLSTDQGILVARIIPGGPAEEAGLTSGDIIVEFSGSAVHTVGELQREMRRRRIGDIVALTLVRGDSSWSTSLRLTKAP